MRDHPRLRSLALLLALAGVQLATLGAAFAGDPSCLCNEQMCTHHPGGHGGHGSHGGSKAAPRVATPSADHCAYQAAVTPERTMRGCEHERDGWLPVTPLGSIPGSTSIVRPERVSPLACLASSSPLERSYQIDPPPPRHLAV